MMEKIDSPSNVLAIRVSGTLTKDDYEKVLTPGIKSLVESTGELRAVIVLADQFGITPGATWEDLKTGFAHVTKWKRCAVVTDKDWVKHGVALFGWMIPGEVKVVDDPSQVDEAIAWAAASV